MRGRASGTACRVVSRSVRVTTLAELASPSRELETHETAATVDPAFFCLFEKDSGYLNFRETLIPSAGSLQP